MSSSIRSVTRSTRSCWRSQASVGSARLTFSTWNQSSTSIDIASHGRRGWGVDGVGAGDIALLTARVSEWDSASSTSRQYDLERPECDQKVQPEASMLQVVEVVGELPRRAAHVCRV